MVICETPIQDCSGSTISPALYMLHVFMLAIRTQQGTLTGLTEPSRNRNDMGWRTATSLLAQWSGIAHKFCTAHAFATFDPPKAFRSVDLCLDCGDFPYRRCTARRCKPASASLQTTHASATLITAAGPKPRRTDTLIFPILLGIPHHRMHGTAELPAPCAENVSYILCMCSTLLLFPQVSFA